MFQAFTGAVRRAGGSLTTVAEASALIMADPFAAADLPGLLEQGPQLEWIQLPFAGSAAFVPMMTDETQQWTCGKGVYAPPVAEHALGLALAGMRNIIGYARTTGWAEQTGRNLIGANVTILGGGGIAEELVKLLEPFGCDITVVRRSSTPLAGASRTIPQSRLFEVLTRTDALFVAWALTPETTGVVNREVFAALPNHAWVVNVGRGAHIATDDLLAALRDNLIGGAALDVTDPEPLPSDHALWELDNCLITPHTANTLAMGQPLITARVEANVRRWITGEDLIGTIDPVAGY